jgi:protoporphyrin/coproporphyrin ferrochelatase
MVPFDAVLVIAFGGPLGLPDVRPFLANVLRGRRVTPERVEKVAHHYELFGGVSPLTALTRAQANGLATELRDRGHELPVYVGMRNWHPYLSETLAEMSRAGVRRAIGFIAAPHRSYSSCTQYRENVRDARAAIRREGLHDVEIIYVEDWFHHPGFIDAAADRAENALKELRPELTTDAMLVFTAHSIPLSMAEQYPYREQYGETARLVAQRARERTGLALPYATTYQSRSGRPEDPWLGPDVCEFLRATRRTGLHAAVLCPIGFISDHIEVLYDLDTEAAIASRDVGLTMVRAQTVNDHPAFISMMADVVLATVRRYANARPLEVVTPSAVSSV